MNVRSTLHLRGIARRLVAVTALLIPALGLGSFAAGQDLGAFRPPATPLVTVDPYMSVWSFSNDLNGSWPVHWTGQVHAMAGMVRVDGRAYRFMGPEGICAVAAKQTALDLRPTETIYTFQAGGVELRLTFTTPALPSDLSLLASPITFLTYDVKPIDGRNHSVAIYFDASGEWVVNTADQKVRWQRVDEPIQGMQFLTMGSVDQPILEKAGDNLRIDWGYLYIGAPADNDTHMVVTSHNVRERFIQARDLPATDDTNMPRAASDDWPVIACTMDLGTLSAPARRVMAIAYDDIYSIEYMHKKLRPWYYKEHGDFTSMLKDCIARYDRIRKDCGSFDRKLLADAARIGGQAYERLVALSYRHTWASGKIVVSPDGTEPWVFNKENFSNGCMATVDVSYPQSPFLALFSPDLLNGLAAPVFEYAKSDAWPFPFAPHDVGTYPKGNGQAYGYDHRTGKLRFESQMPVEECGNMILMTAAAAKASDDTAFAQRYWDLLSQWANYLKDKGLDPENQLCTDDFTGHLAHNANLSVKAIVAMDAYAMLCDMVGKPQEAKDFRSAAKEMAAQWKQMADDGDHYRLAFDKPGTWSMKYNLVWDVVFERDLFDPAIARKEVAYYLKTQNAYGLPLDNRADFTKSDWLVWCATLAEQPDDFRKLINPLYRFVNESPDRVPFSDWYFTSTAKVRGFRARPVIGGIFIPFLKDETLWKQYVGDAEGIRR